VQFTGEVTHFGPEGQVKRVPAASLGQFIRDQADDQLVPITKIANALKSVLTGRQGFWPAKGQTANLGPHARGYSVNQFSVPQSRTAQGKFSHIIMRNDALNRSGKPYAGYVAQGIGVGGARVSPERYRANFDCVGRTWRERWPLIEAKISDGS